MGLKMKGLEGLTIDEKYEIEEYRDRITYDYSSYTALQLAVSKLHLDVVKVLLTAGADTELYTATGCCGTAFHLAASMGRNQQLYLSFDFNNRVWLNKKKVICKPNLLVPL